MIAAFLISCAFGAGFSIHGLIHSALEHRKVAVTYAVMSGALIGASTVIALLNF